MKTAAQIKKELKAAGIKTASISIRVQNSIKCTVKDLAIDLNMVQAIVGANEKIDRCEATGEILAGGNTFVFCDYDWVQVDAYSRAIKVTVLDMLESFSGNWKIEKLVSDISKRLMAEEAACAVESAVYRILSQRVGQIRPDLLVMH